MFLERIAIFTLQVREKLETFLNSLIRETNSRIGEIFFVCCLLFLTGLLYYTWATPSAVWIKILFSLIYISSSLLCISAIHFITKRKRIRKNSNVMEVYTLTEDESKKFDLPNLKAIPLTKLQENTIFKAFSEKHFSGDYQTFQALIQLKPVSQIKRLVWTDSSPKLPKKVNRQTLLEFLSQLFVGFENLENQQMKELANYYFVLKNSEGIENTLSTKNISDWKNNKASYLGNISRLLKKNL
ncbi:DUF4760 domain-containing protein [Gillisia limnaea]|uniref:Uncharacterized protein n=3 Tax=Gillisia TaxID=244698 RepID=H2BXM3_GILLR|nr:hypothetical protein Gilli_2525 [Gillisia limnaea DSM 15749]